MTKQTGIRSQANNMLLQRFMLVTFVVSGLMSIIAYNHSRTMVLDNVIQTTTAKIIFITDRFHELINRPEIGIQTALEDAVNSSPGGGIHSSEGMFVYSLIHDRSRANIGECNHPSNEDTKSLRKYVTNNLQQLMLPIKNEPHYQFVTINGLEYLDIHVALSEKTSDKELFFRSFFKLSEEAEQSIANFTLKSTLFVSMVVAVTTLLLYPVVNLLLRRVASYSDKLLEAHLETMESLGNAIVHRDQETGYHNYRVTLFTIKLAQVVGIGKQEMCSYIKGAYLHDIGKIGIRDDLLLSSRKFSIAEHEAMKSHVIYGLEIISQSSWLKDASAIVGSHHERYDGSGYPQGLKGEKIPIAARIFALSDVFDAMTSARPYKKPYSLSEVREHLEKGRGTHFDPHLLDLFLTIADQLYNTFAGLEDDLVRAEYSRLIEIFFLEGRVIFPEKT